MYLVTVVNKTAIAKTLGIEQELELSWIDGQIGACAVFKYKKDAMKYTGNRDDLVLKMSEVK